MPAWMMIAAIAQGEKPASVDEETERALIGYQLAMTYVLQLAKDPVIVDSTLIRSLHYMATSHDLTKRPGRYRVGPVYVQQESTGDIVHEGAEASAVPALIDELAGSIMGSGDRLIDAAMAHLNFVLIHPFKDGNGRMARVLPIPCSRRGWRHLTGVLFAPQSISGATLRPTTTYSLRSARVSGTQSRRHPSRCAHGSASSSQPISIRRWSAPPESSPPGEHPQRSAICSKPQASTTEQWMPCSTRCSGQPSLAVATSTPSRRRERTSARKQRHGI